ncbi:MAG TPA: type II toxin-antitoxin system VapB family antitoxin [Candidatus Limnocylindrales bacterium]|nr:type II toxin-antitoxin system VapB family antitoxin [Candidatus Limnocylindrales bacterium]
MSLNIKNEETVRLVKELAAELDMSMTAAITEAVRTRLDAVRAERAEDGVDWEKVVALAAEMREMLGEEYLGQDFDALLYDEMGLPK